LIENLEIILVVFIGGVAFSISHAIIPREEGENIKHLAAVFQTFFPIHHFFSFNRFILHISIGYQLFGSYSVLLILFIINEN
jgi:hypothetical protein